MTDSRTFRLRFWALLLAYLVATQITVVAVCGVLWIGTGKKPISLLLSPRWLVLGGIVAVVVWLGWRIRVGPAGIMLPRTGGLLAWNEVHRADLVRFVGLPYMRLQVKTHSFVRVPLVLQDLRGFIAEVTDKAGPDHPLSQMLNEWMEGNE